MFGKMMNNYYYGKSGKGDYRKEDLPRNRWQLFWEMLRIRFAGLVRLNLMYTLIWLPTMVVVLFNGFALLDFVGRATPMADETGAMTLMSVSAPVAVEENAAASEFAPPAEPEEPVVFTGAEFLEIITGTLFQTLIFLIPCIAITGPFTAGVSYVTRNWARDEHAFVWSDFKDAVKENWKQGLVVSVITSIVPVLVYMCWTFYGEMANESFLYVVPQMLTVMVSIVWLLATVYLYPLMVSYKLNLRTLLKNGIVLAIAKLPQSVGVRLVTLVPMLIGILAAFFFVGPTWVILIEFLYYLVIGYTLTRFVFASYTNGVFDRFINPNIEGAPVNRGLSDEPDDDDEEYEDEE